MTETNEARILILINRLTANAKQSLEASRRLEKALEELRQGEHLRTHTSLETSDAVREIMNQQDALKKEFANFIEQMNTWARRTEVANAAVQQRQMERETAIETILTGVVENVRREMKKTREFVLDELEKYVSKEIFTDWQQNKEIERLTYNKDIRNDVDTLLHEFESEMEARFAAIALKTFQGWEDSREEAKRTRRAAMLSFFLDRLNTIPWQVWVFTPVGFLLATGILHPDDARSLLEYLKELFDLSGGG